jgi:hypothetical protein
MKIWNFGRRNGLSLSKFLKDGALQIFVNVFGSVSHPHLVILIKIFGAVHHQMVLVIFIDFIFVFIFIVVIGEALGAPTLEVVIKESSEKKRIYKYSLS